MRSRASRGSAAVAAGVALGTTTSSVGQNATQVGCCRKKTLPTSSREWVLYTRKNLSSPTAASRGWVSWAASPVTEPAKPLRAPAMRCCRKSSTSSLPRPLPTQQRWPAHDGNRHPMVTMTMHLSSCPWSCHTYWERQALASCRHIVTAMDQEVDLPGVQSWHS